MFGFVSSFVSESACATDNLKLVESGSIVHSAAPFVTIGEIELNLLSYYLFESNPQILPRPKIFSKFEYRQYGSGTHASPRRNIMGYVEI